MSSMTTAAMALTLFAVFATLGFGWRSWAQYRATGSTGFKGIGGRPGSVEWFAGVGFVLAMVVAVVGPVLQLAGAVTPVGGPQPWWLTAAGALTALSGIAATVYAQVTMGQSWRIGVDHDEVTDLVRTGVFGRVRNPIFSAMVIFGAGMTLLTPNVVAIAGLVLLVASIELQVRCVEEPYLATVHGDDYRSYTADVGRFVPCVGVTTPRP